VFEPVFPIIISLIALVLSLKIILATICYSIIKLIYYKHTKIYDKLVEHLKCFNINNLHIYSTSILSLTTFNVLVDRIITNEFQRSKSKALFELYINSLDTVNESKKVCVSKIFRKVMTTMFEKNDYIVSLVLMTLSKPSLVKLYKLYKEEKFIESVYYNVINDKPFSDGLGIYYIESMYNYQIIQSESNTILVKLDKTIYAIFPKPPLFTTGNINELAIKFLNENNIDLVIFIDTYTGNKGTILITTEKINYINDSLYDLLVKHNIMSYNILVNIKNTTYELTKNDTDKIYLIHDKINSLIKSTNSENVLLVILGNPYGLNVSNGIEKV
jgi:hypothetical protein